MGIGTGIFVFVIGAVIVFALNIDIPGMSDDTLGYILMGAGALIALISLVMANQKRGQRSVATRTHSDGQQTVTERNTESDPPPAV